VPLGVAPRTVLLSGEVGTGAISVVLVLTGTVGEDGPESVESGTAIGDGMVTPVRLPLMGPKTGGLTGELTGVGTDIGAGAGEPEGVCQE
jgi:hypothetical protein